MSIKLSEHILVAEDLNKTDIYKEKKFPKETHFQKKEETIYRDFYKVFKVKKVIKSDKIKVGELIKVYQIPAYPEELVRQSHEEGMLESPIVEESTPRFPSKESTKIIFLQNFEKIYLQSGSSPSEGMSGLGEIEGLIDIDSHKTLFYFEDRSQFHGDGESIVLGEKGLLFSHKIKIIGNGKSKETICQKQIGKKDLNSATKLIKEISWSKLEFKGTLVPDETVPVAYVGLEHKRSWSIRINILPSNKLPVDITKYQELLLLLRNLCPEQGWVEKKIDEINFSNWPEKIRPITQ